MGTRRWTISTFMGCCIWILHGLRAAAAIPVTTEGPFAAGTVSPIATESGEPRALVVGTAETNTTVANAEPTKSILAGSPSSPSFPPGAQTDASVTVTSAFGSTAPTLINVTKPLNASQDNEGGLAAPTAATSTSAISAQHPAVTPEAALDVTGAAPTTPLGTTPLFAALTEDVFAAVTREEAEKLDPTVGDVLFPTLPAVTRGAQPAAGSPVGAGVTVLPSQGLTTSTGAVREGTTLLVGAQREAGANSWSPSPSAGRPITTQQDEVLSGAGGIAPEPEGETAPAAEASPSASVPGDRGDAVNGEFSTAGSSLLSSESVAVGSPGEPSRLPSQAALSPAGDGAEAPTSPDLAAASGTPVSPSLRVSQPWGITAGAPQGANGPGTGSSSASDVPSPASFVPDGLVWPAAGVQGQGAEGPGDIAQAGGPGDGSHYADIQSDTSSSAFSNQQDAANTGELPAGETGALVNAELSPPSALGDRTGTGAAPALGQVSPPGPASLSSAGLQPDLSEAEGPGDLPSEFPSAPGAAYPPLGSVAGPISGAETPVSADFSAPPGAPVSPSFEEPQPWGTAAGAPQGAGLPGASGPGTVLTSAWDVPNSAAYGPAGPPSPALGDQFGTNPGLPAAEGHGAGTTEPVLGGAGSGTEFEPSLISAADSGTVAGVNQLPGAGSLPGSASPSDVVATSSVSEDAGTGLIPAAAPAPHSLSPASPDSETDPEFPQVLEAVSTGNAAQAGNAESESPYTETSPTAFSAQQDAANTGELPAGETGALANAELSPPSALGDRAGAAPALGEVSPPGPASLGSAGLQPDLSGAERPGDLPGEFPSAPGAAYPPLGSAAGLISGAETPVSPYLSAPPGAPVSPSFEEPQPWGTAAGALQGAGLPGASRPGTVLTSAWDVPNSAAYGPAGPPSPALGDQFGTNPGLPAAEGHGAGTTEPVLGGAGSGTEFEPSLISAADSGTAAGVNQLPGAGSLSGPASPSDVVATSSVSEDAGTGLIPAAAPVPHSLSPASPDSETGPEFSQILGAVSTGNAAQAGNPESESPYTETSPSAFSAQQDAANTGELPAGETGALVNAELSPPSALGDRAGAAAALGQVSPPGPASLGSTGLQPDLSGAERPGDLPNEFPSAPGAAYPPLGSVAGPISEAETPVSADFSASPGAPASPSFEEPQPWGTAAGAPQGAGLPGASGPGTVLTSAWDVPNSAAYGPAGPPSPALGDQFGTNPGLPAAEGHGAGTTEPVLGGAGSGTEFEPSLISAADSGTAAGANQLPGAGSLPGPVSPSDVVATSSVSEDAGTGFIPAAAPAPHSLFPASLNSETGSGLAQVLGADSTGNAAQVGNPEGESSYMETSPSAFSAQQDPSNTGELPTGETGALVNAELSPPSALGGGTGTGAAPALGQVSPPGPASLSSAGLQPDLSGAEGPGDLPNEFPSAPGAAYPPLGSAAGPISGAETPVSPDLSAPPGAPVSPSFEEPQPWGTAVGAPQGAGLPGASGPGTVLTSAWDVPNSAAYGPAGPPSPALGDQFGTNPGLPAAEGHGAGTREPVLGGAGSGTEFEPSLISAAGSGTAAGVNQLPGAGSLPGPSSPSDVVAASSLSDTASPGALGGVGSAPGALQHPLGAGPEVPPAAGEGAGEAAGDGTSLGQTAAEGQPAGSGAPDGEAAAVLQSASTSSSTVGSSSPGTAGEAANGANPPGAGEASNGLSTVLEAAGPEEPRVSAPGIQSDADLGLSGAKLSQVDVVDLPGGALANRGPSSNASLGEGAGPITQITSGASAPSALTSPQETRPLVPVAPGAGGVPVGTATSLPASLLLPGHGLTSGLAPNGDPHFVPSTQSGSTPLALGAPGGQAGDAGGAQLWSPEDKVASGVPAPSGEASPHAPTSPNAAPVLPSAPEGENSAVGVSAGPGLSARESLVGSSAGGRGELGAAVLGGAALLLPPRQLGSPGDPSRDADGLVPGEASAVLPGVMAGRGDIAQLLPSVTGARAAMETPPHSSLGGSPGLSGLPPTRIAAGSPGSKIPEPGPVSGLSPAGMQPFLGNQATTSLTNGALAASGSSLPVAVPAQGGTPRGSPATARLVVSCSPVTTSPAPPAPTPGVREVLPSPAAATVTSRASSPVFPAPPGGPVTALNLLPSPTVPAVPLYGYGARENDREYVERRVDFNSPLFKPETGFPFGKTVRSSLYFTDNGQIIFPASDNSIFTYPNPPPRGFNGREEVPMIAVFWDNADFSRGVGTTYYQEFPTLNTNKPPFVRDVEAKVRRYLRSSYSAAWTLKVTWEKAPAYGARTDTRRTITYQAVLTTDGFRSYVLMLYQAGGMQWDYTRLAATNVLIGYTSGDGFYRNDDLTRRPPAAKYRPDQFRGYNTDLHGLWIYKLESRVGINYRLKCLAWTGQQQEPRMWSQGLPACPCTLKQGQQDPRFKSSRGGWGAAHVSMLHSASPNQYGAGVRCLYDSQSRLIEGRQERYWRFSRLASPFRDQELKLYDWCCNQAGSAQLCARYSEKRPKIGCDGYQSPGAAATGSSEEAESNSEEQEGRDDE